MLTNHWCQWHSPNLQICLDMYLFHLGVLSKARQAAHAIINPRCKGRCNSVQNSIGAHCTHCLQCVPLSASSVQLYIHIYIYIKNVPIYKLLSIAWTTNTTTTTTTTTYIYIYSGGGQFCYVFVTCLLCVCYVFAMFLLCLLLCFCYVFVMFLLCCCYVFGLFLLCFCYAFNMLLLCSPTPPEGRTATPWQAGALLKKAPSGRTAAPSLILCTESSHFVLRAPTLY